MTTTEKACWNSIGVWGRQQQKCERLQDVIHCRNCEVFTNAGGKLFERTTPEEYIKQWSRAYSLMEQIRAQNQLSVVVFRLGDNWFCLPTEFFNSIEQDAYIHSVPRFSNQTFLGIVNIKGTLQLCFSLTETLDVELRDSNRQIHSAGIYQRLVVLYCDNETFVFPVDEVGGVYRIDETNLESVIGVSSTANADLIQGMIKLDGKNISLIHVRPLLACLKECLGGRR